MTNTPPIKVLMVDDHQMFVDALSRLLAAEPDIEMVGTATTGEDALRLCRRLRPEVVLMDVDLPGMNGLEATRQLLRICPDTKVVIVSPLITQTSVADAIEAGASAYVPKTQAADRVIEIVRKASAGETLPDPVAMTDLLKDSPPAVPPIRPLTARELEVLQAISEGMSTAEVAGALFISAVTVQSHVKNILSKLDVHSKLAAVVQASRRGLLPLSQARPGGDNPVANETSRSPG